MNREDVRFLFGYDRWATDKLLAVARTVPEPEWSESNRIDRRGLGGILVHALGAHERWRAGWQGTSMPARREDLPLISADELLDAWSSEWLAMDVYLDEISDEDVRGRFDDVRLWHTFAHVVNHGTQHRSEAAVLLTIMGRSPGDLDLIDYAPAIEGD